MKPISLFVLLSILFPLISSAGIDPSNKFKLGDGTNTSKYVEANIGSSPTNPKIRYNSNTQVWEVSNDGSTYSSMGGGSSGTTFSAVAGENLTANDAVYVCNSTGDASRTVGRVYKLDVTKFYRYVFAGFATSTVTAGQTEVVQVAGELSGFTALNVGLQFWASITTPGGFQLSAPDSNTKLVMPLGQASTTTTKALINGALSATVSGTYPLDYIVANCGTATVTTDGNFKVCTYTSSSTFQVLSGSGAGAHVESLVVAGGGGGAAQPDGGGGGGAGGLIHTTPGAIYTAGTYTVTVGPGGLGGIAGGVQSGSSGSNSIFDPSGANIIAIGGGGAANNGTGSNGGSGGGGGGAAANPGGNGTVGQGNNGGTATGAGSNGGGGGGGCGAVGGNAVGFGAAGSGGVGCSSSITGSAVFYAGGGGGNSSNGSEGAGGNGGGGAGIGTANGTDGTPNTGGGGGAGHDVIPFRGGNGGSGVVILRYQFQP